MEQAAQAQKQVTGREILIDVSRHLNIEMTLESLKSELGITFIETVVSLLLLATLMLVLFRLGTSLMPVLMETPLDTLALRKELVIRKALDKGFGEISPPWWLREYPVQNDGNRWIFPYIAGKESDTLTLEWEDHSLKIWQSDVLSHSFPAVEIFDLTLITQESGRIICQVRINGDTMLFPFAGGISPGRKLL